MNVLLLIALTHYLLLILARRRWNSGDLSRRLSELQLRLEARDYSLRGLPPHRNVAELALDRSVQQLVGAGRIAPQQLAALRDLWQRRGSSRAKLVSHGSLLIFHGSLCLLLSCTLPLFLMRRLWLGADASLLLAFSFYGFFACLIWRFLPPHPFLDDQEQAYLFNAAYLGASEEGPWRETLCALTARSWSEGRSQEEEKRIFLETWLIAAETLMEEQLARREELLPVWELVLTLILSFCLGFSPLLDTLASL